MTPSLSNEASTVRPFLRTKLYIPTPRSDLVPRARLIARLDDGLRLGRRLTLVSAPAGSGKTMLLAEWAHGVPAPPLGAPPSAQIAWLSLDVDDNDPTRFLAYLIAAIEQQLPGIGADVHALHQAHQPPAMKTQFTVLINNLTAIPDNSVLILDDYHVIEQQAIHDAVSFLLEHLPPNLHLIIASRTDPPLPLPRLRARRQITEIRASDLRFTHEEAARFLNDIMALNLTPADIAKLEARTEGWIASLQLAALSLRGRDASRVTNFITDFSGSHRHVIDYLAEEVLAQQPADIRAFLLQTAILNRMTASLCDALLRQEAASAQSTLEYLEHANLFVVPLDDERRWYRYHRLFADFLRNHLQQARPGHVHDLHCRAADWYEQHEMIPEAIGHTLEAQEFEHAARLIQAIAPEILKRSEAITSLRWLQTMPDALVRANPHLSLLYAEVLLLTGDSDLCETYLHGAEQSLKEITSEEDRRGILSQIAAIRAYIATYRGDLSQGAELAQQALAYLPPENTFLRTLVTWLLGFTQFFDTDIPAAQRAFGDALKLSQATDNTLISALSIFVSGYLDAIQGHLRKAHVFFEQNLKLFKTQWSTEDEQGTTSLPSTASLVYQGLSEVLREMNRMDAAKQHMIRCLALAEQWGNAEVLVDSYVVLARIHQGCGELAAARQMLDKAIALVYENKVSPLTARQIQAHQARIWVALGNLDAAARWADDWVCDHGSAPLSEGNIELFVNWIEISSLARIRIVQRRFDEALHYLRSLRSTMESIGWMGIAIELLGLEALALHGQGARSEALHTLHRALSLAEPEGYVRIFLDMGRQMKALLQQALNQGIMTDYASKLLQVESQKSEIKDSTQTRTDFQHSMLAPGLSDRERDVLRLIAEGLTNQEIADALYIAISTVKTHINNIYGKLDVSNRVQALARAGELGIILNDQT